MKLEPPLIALDKEQTNGEFASVRIDSEALDKSVNNISHYWLIILLLRHSFLSVPFPSSFTVRLQVGRECSHMALFCLRWKFSMALQSQRDCSQEHSLFHCATQRLLI